MDSRPDSGSRRTFLKHTTLLAGTAALGGIPVGRASSPFFSLQKEKEEEKVSPAEDLMREHGVLKRVLLVYNEINSRMAEGKDFPPEALSGVARIIKDFIEDYHEKSEENHIFPRFQKAGQHVDLVTTLKTQHDRGRTITLFILKNATSPSLKDPSVKRKLSAYIHQFVRMYNPHEAREDTILFPAFRKLISGNEYDALGEEFEKQEHAKFGEDGFEKYVEKVAGLEKSLGIFDLTQFTPEL